MNLRFRRKTKCGELVVLMLFDFVLTMRFEGETAGLMTGGSGTAFKFVFGV